MFYCQFFLGNLINHWKLGLVYVYLAVDLKLLETLKKIKVLDFVKMFLIKKTLNLKDLKNFKRLI